MHLDPKKLIISETISGLNAFFFFITNTKPFNSLKTSLLVDVRRPESVLNYFI